MQSLLALYLVNSLLKPGTIEKVWGLTALSQWIGGETMSIQALASSIYGFYLAACYATPLLGGFIADRVLGRTPTIVLGAVFLIFGHFLMAFNATFLIALLFLLSGVGLMKGNVATQIGELYAPDDLRRTDAFQIFVASFQIAGIIAPLICGTLGEVVGWHYGFGAAGISMAIGLAIYLAARRHFPPDPPIVRRATGGRPPMTAAERRSMWVLMALVPVFGLVSIVNDQIYNAYIIWGARSFDRMFFGYQMPASWLGSIDTIAAIVSAVLVIAFWRWFSRSREDADEITKVAIGGIFSVGAALILALASLVMQVTGDCVRDGRLHRLRDDLRHRHGAVCPCGTAQPVRSHPRHLLPAPGHFQPACRLAGRISGDDAGYALLADPRGHRGCGDGAAVPVPRAVPAGAGAGRGR